MKLRPTVLALAFAVLVAAFPDGAAAQGRPSASVPRTTGETPAEKKTETTDPAPANKAKRPKARKAVPKRCLAYGHGGKCLKCEIGYFPSPPEGLCRRVGDFRTPQPRQRPKPGTPPTPQPR